MEDSTGTTDSLMTEEGWFEHVQCQLFAPAKNQQSPAMAALAQRHVRMKRLFFSHSGTRPAGPVFSAGKKSICSEGFENNEND